MQELVRLIPRYHEKTKRFLERCCLPNLAEAQAAPPAPPRSALRNQALLTLHSLLVDQVVNCGRPARRGCPAAGPAGRSLSRRDFITPFQLRPSYQPGPAPLTVMPQQARDLLKFYRVSIESLPLPRGN